MAVLALGMATGCGSSRPSSGPGYPYTSAGSFPGSGASGRVSPGQRRPNGITLSEVLADVGWDPSGIVVNGPLAIRESRNVQVFQSSAFGMMVIGGVSLVEDLNRCRLVLDFLAERVTDPDRKRQIEGVAAFYRDFGPRFARRIGRATVDLPLSKTGALSLISLANAFATSLDEAPVAAWDGIRDIDDKCRRLVAVLQQPAALGALEGRQPTNISIRVQDDDGAPADYALAESVQQPDDIKKDLDWLVGIVRQRAERRGVAFAGYDLTIDPDRVTVAVRVDYLEPLTDMPRLAEAICPRASQVERLCRRSDTPIDVELHMPGLDGWQGIITDIDALPDGGMAIERKDRQAMFLCLAASERRKLALFDQEQLVYRSDAERESYARYICPHYGG